MNKQKVELFTAGCPVCEPTVELVKSMACSNCEVIIYDLSKLCDTKECLTKVKEFSITSLPAIAVNGKLLGNFSTKYITKEELIKAGIGTNN